MIFLENNKYRYTPFPHMKVTKSGIEFLSYQKHKIFIRNLKIKTVGDIVYLISDKQIILCYNIKILHQTNNNLFFKAKGKVKFVFNCKEIYKYFNINIKMANLDFLKMKYDALIDIVNNCFEVKEKSNAEKFFKFIKNILKIQIKTNKICISSNKLLIPYQITYKVNNTIKKINVSNSIGKI